MQGRFATMGENIFRIVNKLCLDKRLIRLLKYQVKDPFDSSLPDLTGEDLINKQIIIVPRIPDDTEEKSSFVIITFDKFFHNETNLSFKLLTIRFDVVCPFDEWILSIDSFRPFLIMQEIDTLFNGVRLSGLGKLSFLESKPLVLSPQLGGYSMWYAIDEFN